ncbi:MAG: FHA domain-containing protein [Planctomycetota bacterium]|nr:MAG: FHA domain-containing protein [Planctomycetota bacterium]
METLSEMMEKYKDYTEDQFLREFPGPFLVSDAELQPGSDDFQTRTDDLTNLVKEVLAAPHKIADPSVRKVIAVKKKSSSSYENMITLGRTDNNDIVLKFGFISKFHAYFLRLPDGRYTISDAESFNRTVVNSEPLKPHEKRQLEFGDRITIGPLSFTYFPPRAFYDYFIKDGGKKSKET